MPRHDSRLAFLGLACCSEAKDKFSIAEDRDVRVVCREDELAAAFSCRMIGTTTSVMKRLSRSSSG